MHPTASGTLVALFVPLPVVVAVALALGWSRATRASFPKALAFVTVWLAFVAALGWTGVLNRWDARPPPLMIFFIGVLALAVTAALSSVGRKIGDALPLASLIAFQAFRLPLELVMHRAAAEGTMPVQMSFGGLNFDIASGITSILAAILVARGIAPKAVALAWSVLSSILLVVVLCIAVASLPMFARFGPERVMTWVVWFPFVLLPGVLVPAALFGQIVLWRRLLTS
jgi:hypothetical protein